MARLQRTAVEAYSVEYYKELAQSYLDIARVKIKNLKCLSTDTYESDPNDFDRVITVLVEAKACLTASRAIDRNARAYRK